MNKAFRKSIMVLFILGVLLLTAACGGGGGTGAGGGTDVASISVEGGPSFQYTLTVNKTAPEGFSPDLWSISSQPQSAHIYCREWTGSAYVMRFQIDVYSFAGMHAGNYLITDLGNSVQFSPPDGTTYSTLGTGTSGTITISELGGSGSKIKGTFDVIANVTSLPTSTARLTGDFSVTRWLAY